MAEIDLKFMKGNAETVKAMRTIYDKEITFAEPEDYLPKDELKTNLEVYEKGKQIEKRILDKITRNDVLMAIRRWDNDEEIDPELKKSKYKSKTYKLLYRGKEYRSKVIFAIAYEVHFGMKIMPDNLSGGISGSNTVGTHLLELGFEVIDSEKTPEIMDDTHTQEEIAEHSQSLSIEALRVIAESQTAKTPKKTSSTITQYTRSTYIADYVRRRANGVCQLCGEAAPFSRKDGTPYLESHHIVWLAEGGEDSVDNTVALCPNCHRKMHIVADPEDIKKLLKANKL